MKMQIKRIMTLLSAAAIVVACAACRSAKYDYSYYESSIPGSTVSTDSTVSSTDSSKASTVDSQPNSGTQFARDKVIAKMPASLRGTTIKYMYWHDAKTQMEKEAIESFEKATGIKVETIVASYNDFLSELNIRIAAGNAPDLIRNMGNNQYMLRNLQPITNSGYNFNDGEWDTWIMNQYTFNGKCYAVNLKDSAILDVMLMTYNKKALRAADMDNDDPYKLWKSNPSKWTWEKFWSLCDEFVKANGSKSEYYGAIFAYYETYVRAMGGGNFYYDPSKGKYINISTKQATVDAWKKTLEAYDKHWLATEYESASFERNRVLFNAFGPFAVRKNDASLKNLKDSGDLGVVPLPTDSANTLLYEMTSFSIPVGSKNAAAVPYYLRWVLDKNSYNWNNIFCSSEARTVVDSLTKATNFYYGHGEIAELRGALIGGGSAQVNSILNSYSGTIDARVKSENEAMVTLPQ